MAAQGGLASESVAHFLGCPVLGLCHALEHGTERSAGGQPGSHDVDPHACRADFFGHRLGHRLHSAFGRRVARQPLHQRGCAERGDVDYRPAASGCHVGRSTAADLHCADDVDLYGPQVVVPVEVGDRNAAAPVGGDVDDHVDPAELADCGFDRISALRRVGDVGDNRERLSAGRLGNLGGEAFEGFAPASGEGHVSPLVGQRQRAAAADSPAGSNYERYRVLK